MLPAILIIGGLLLVILSFAGALGASNDLIGGAVGVFTFIAGLILLKKPEDLPPIEMESSPATTEIEPTPEPTSEVGDSDIPEPGVSPEAQIETLVEEPVENESGDTTEINGQDETGSTYKKIATTEEVPEGQAKAVDLEGHTLAIFNLSGTFYVIDDTCTHMQASLSEGEIEDDEVACPLHGACFNIKTGATLGPPAMTDVKCYNVRVTGSDIEIEI